MKLLCSGSCCGYGFPPGAAVSSDSEIDIWEHFTSQPKHTGTTFYNFFKSFYYTCFRQTYNALTNKNQVILVI